MHTHQPVRFAVPPQFDGVGMKDPLIERVYTWFRFVIIALATFRIWWVVRFGTWLWREAYWEYVTTKLWRMRAIRITA